MNRCSLESILKPRGREARRKLYNVCARRSDTVTRSNRNRHYGLTCHPPEVLGFTLIEVMLVLALLALLFANVLPKASNLFRVSVQSSVRRFGAMVRFAYDDAILTGRLHRIVLNIDEQTWGVEMANPGELPIDKTRRELNPYLKNRNLKDDEEDPDEPSFRKVGGGVLSPIPTGVAIVDAKSWRLGDKPVTKGVVSIYAYPSGLMDEATVRFAEVGKEDSQTFSVTVQPVTGRIDIEVEKKPQ